jgi:hypothetical protein
MGRYMVVFIIGLAAALLPTLLEKRWQALMFGIFGLLPGAACFWIASCETPPVPGRKWLIVYAVALSVVGCVIAVVYRNYLEDLGRGALMLMLLPVIPVAIADERFKRKEREHQHQRAIETSRRKFDPL